MAGDRSRKRLDRTDVGLRLAFGAVGVALAVILLVGALGTKPAAASFTRVGGSTRLETALESARFWDPPPKTLVEIHASSSNASIMDAARCAMRLDAPLVFFRGDRTRPLGEPIDSWRESAELDELVLTERNPRACANGRKSFKAEGLSVFDIRDDPLELPEVAPAKEPASFALFAAAKSPTQSPDIAVALALGAHLARDRESVSLIIVPRYPQTDRVAEDRLRDQSELVKGGVVVGESGILSDDSRTLLRQLLVARDPWGFIGDFGNLLNAVLTMALAILAFLGLRAALPLVDAVGHGVIVSSQHVVDAPGESERWKTMMQEFWKGSRDPDAAERKAWLAQREAWFTDLKDEPVTVWLRSGGIVFGTVAKDSPAGAVRLTDVTLARPGSEPDQRAETMLVPLEDALLVAHSASAAPAAGIRGASLRLVAEIVAELTGEPLTALDEQILVDAVEAASEEFEGTEPPPRFDLNQLIDEAWAARDVELHAALRALEDGFEVMGRRAEDAVARDVFFDALTRVAHVGAQPVSWTALGSAERPVKSDQVLNKKRAPRL